MVMPDHMTLLLFIVASIAFVCVCVGEYVCVCVCAGVCLSGVCGTVLCVCVCVCVCVLFNMCVLLWHY